MVIALALATFAALAVQQARKSGGGSAGAWARGAGLLLLLLISLRFGSRVLPLVGPVALWLFMGLWAGLPGRRGPAQESSGRRSRMSRDEALRILGVPAGASKEQVLAAHRQLIKKLHPDQGGSSFLAQQVNEAKQVLLEG